MQIVIEISEERYNTLKAGFVQHGSTDERMIVDAVKNGTPLPKGHGKLVDISKIDDDRIDSDNPIIELTINGEYIEAVSLDYLDSLPTIIPKDKEGENDDA